jgi:hypothetical protein
MSHRRRQHRNVSSALRETMNFVCHFATGTSVVEIGRVRRPTSTGRIEGGISCARGREPVNQVSCIEVATRIQDKTNVWTKSADAERHAGRVLRADEERSVGFTILGARIDRRDHCMDNAHGLRR